MDHLGAVALVRDLLRIDTTNPPGNEGAAAELLEGRLAGAGLKTEIYSSDENRPNLVARLEGPSDAPALVLLSHTDVVPVEADRWSRDPFGADEHEGHIYGRGALDMKSIAAMHALAAIALAESGATPAREVIACFVADEETGGGRGARWLLSEHADAVGFGDGRPPPEVIGEGGFGISGILDVPILPVVLGEKNAFWVRLVARGAPGHGSLPPARQAIASLTAMIERIAGYSAPRIHPVMRTQFEILAARSSGIVGRAFKALASPAGPVAARALAPRLRATGMIGALLSDTITPTMLSAGYKENVVPSEASAAVDCRLLPDTDPDRFVARLTAIGARHAVDVVAPDFTGGPVSEPSSTYRVIEEVSAGLSPAPVVVPSLTAGFTDVRFFRARGATGYGWVPLVITPQLLGTIHGHDECIPVDGLLQAAEATAEVVRRAAT